MISAGLFASMIIFAFPTKSYKLFAPILWMLVFACLIGLFIYSSIKRGSINWLTIKGFTFQPSEFAKPIIIVTLSILFEIISKYVLNHNYFEL